MILSRLGAKWQTTVPLSVREALGVSPGDRLAYRIEGGLVFVSRAEGDEESGEDELHSDAEIQAAIDEALNDPRPTVPAEEAFAEVYAYIKERRRLADAA